MSDTSCRGQSFIEAAILIVVAVAAFVGVFQYTVSALSSRAKSGADGVGQGMLTRVRP